MFQAKRGACSVTSIRVVADIVKAKPIGLAMKGDEEEKQAEVQVSPSPGPRAASETSLTLVTCRHLPLPKVETLRAR